MKIEIVEANNVKLAHITSVDRPIKARRDAFVAMLGADYQVAGVAIDEQCFHPDFFDLKTGVAGEILQVFTTYQLKVAIVGGFAKYDSDSLRGLIRECNRGRKVVFVSDAKEAAKYFQPE